MRAGLQHEDVAAGSTLGTASDLRPGVSAQVLRPGTLQVGRNGRRCFVHRLPEYSDLAVKHTHTPVVSAFTDYLRIQI